MSDFEYRVDFDVQPFVDRIVERINYEVDEAAVKQVEGRLAELGYRKCATCTERQGYYLDAETIRNKQEHIAELESLVRDLWDGYDCFQCKLFCDECKVKSQEQMEAVGPCKMERRISALGIEVDE